MFESITGKSSVESPTSERTENPLDIMNKKTKMKLYQINVKWDLQGKAIRNNPRYVVAENKEKALLRSGLDSNSPGDKNYEAYALTVSKETLDDEISHCRLLIDYWTSEYQPTKLEIEHNTVDTIVKRQRMLIKHFSDLQTELEER